MKILAISDVHGCFEKVYHICKKENPDIVLFSGDGLKDVIEISDVFSDIKFVTVRGNCDYDSFSGDEELISIVDKKIYLTHGHLFSVKRNYNYIKERGIELEADIVIFGHTHIPYLETKDNLTLFNPGAVISNSYGVISMNKNKEIEFIHKNID